MGDTPVLLVPCLRDRLPPAVQNIILGLGITTNHIRCESGSSLCSEYRTTY